MDALVVLQVREGAVLTPEFQGHQELFSYAERGWAAGFLLPCFSCGQHRFHLREGFGIHSGAASELLAVHLQRAGQAVVLYLFSLTRDFRKTSTKNVDCVGTVNIAARAS